MLYILLAVLISIIYCEIMWAAVKSGNRPYDYMSRFLKFLALFNFLLAIMWHSVTSLTLAVTLLFYQMVIYEQRFLKLDKE